MISFRFIWLIGGIFAPLYLITRFFSDGFYLMSHMGRNAVGFTECIHASLVKPMRRDTNGCLTQQQIKTKILLQYKRVNEYKAISHKVFVQNQQIEVPFFSVTRQRLIDEQQYWRSGIKGRGRKGTEKQLFTHVLQLFLSLF